MRQKKQMSSEALNIAVIGAGVGGLSVAARLLAMGHRVTVFESADVVGGKLGLLTRDGFRFDTGPSIVTLPYVYRDLWTDIGGNFDEEVPMRRLDPIARYRFADGSWFDSCADDSQFYDQAEALQKGNAKQLQAFFKRAESIWSATRGPFLERPLGGAIGLLKQSRHIGDLQTIAPWKSLRALSKEYLSDPRMVTFIDRYATYSGSDPRKAPAALASIPFVERHYGGWYIEGGLYVLAERLAAHVLRLGGEIRCNASVVKILTVHGAANGVVTGDGSMFAVDIVIANADASHVYGDLLSPEVARLTTARVKRTARSLSGFVMCLGVDEATQDIAHHTVLFPNQYDNEFDDLFGSNVQAVREPTIYASVPRDPAVAPSGSQAWFVLVNAPCQRVGGESDSDGGASQGIDWTAPGFADRYADRLLDQMAARGVDIRDRIRFRELRTPADLQTRTGTVGGAIYGTSSNGPLAAFLRPANQSPVRNLFLVGGSSHPGGGLPLVTLSAHIVSNIIADR
jgi:phytoene desaturase